MRLIHLFPLALTFACNPVDPMEENIPFAGGKADGIAPGQIQSPYADPTKAYFSRRKLDILKQVGALEPASEQLAQRIDGIIASMPKDGYIAVAELLQFDRPEFFASLLPDEKASLPKLWKLLELDPVVQANEAPTVDLSATAKQLFPTQPKVDENKRELIASLPSELQLVATRAALIGGAPTDEVRILDLRNAVRQPAPFLPDEIPLLQAAFDTLVRLQLSDDLAPRIVVPKGNEDYGTISLGNSTLALSSETKVFRGTYFQKVAYYLRDPDSLVLFRALNGTLTVGNGEQVVLIPPKCENASFGNDERFWSANNEYTCAGTSYVETWSSGVRTSQTRLNLDVGIHSAREDRFAAGFFGDLPVVAESDTFKDCGYVDIKDAYGRVTGNRQECVDKSGLVFPTKKLPTVLLPGRYQLPQVYSVTPVLQVYANSIITIELGTSSAVLRSGPAFSGTGERMTASFPYNGLNPLGTWSFDPVTEKLEHHSGSNVVVTPDMRN